MENRNKICLLSSVLLCLLVGGSAYQCGEQANGALCPGGLCCSKWGWCGSTALHCGDGCQSQCDDSAGDCLYEVIVETGNQPNAGTNSTISLSLSSANGNSLTIEDLRKWGAWGENRVYFQPGASDLFRGTADCKDVCAITITSDGKGENPAWYLTSVEVRVLGRYDIWVKDFPVNQWLDSSEGNQLYATVNLCSQESPALSSIV